MAQFIFNFSRAQRDILGDFREHSTEINRQDESRLLLKQSYPGSLLGFQKSTQESIRVVYEGDTLRLVAFNDEKYNTFINEYRNNLYLGEKDSIPTRIVNVAIGANLRFLPQEWNNVVSRQDILIFLNELYEYLWEAKTHECATNPLARNLFIHRGSSSFDWSYFQPVENRNHDEWNKPYYGLWACPVGDQYIQWAEFAYNLRNEEDLKKSFTFRMSNNSKVIQITTLKDLEKIEKYRLTQDQYPLYDYEQMDADGIDALIVIISNDRKLIDFFPHWDVDSIVVFNPSAIEIIS